MQQRLHVMCTWFIMWNLSTRTPLNRRCSVYESKFKTKPTRDNFVSHQQEIVNMTRELEFHVQPMTQVIKVEPGHTLSRISQKYGLV